MKIISNFKDYYDKISGQHTDSGISYFRKRRSLLLQCPEIGDLNLAKERHRVNSLARDKKPKTQVFVSFEIIGFCDEFVPVIKSSVGTQAWWTFQDNEFETFYDVDAFLLFLDHNCPQYFSWNAIPEVDYRKRMVHRWKQFFSFKGNPFLRDQFAKFNVPVFIVAAEELYGRNSGYDPMKPNVWFELNPSLIEHNFVKVKDPFTAHQQLSDFLGGVLKIPERPMVEVSDKDKLHKHGFDKWSFRKMSIKR